jgi:hypothetical protein
VVGNIFFNLIVLVAAASDECVDAKMAINFEDMLWDRFATNLHHRFGLEMGFFTQACTKTAGKDRRFHRRLNMLAKGAVLAKLHEAYKTFSLWPSPAVTRWQPHERCGKAIKGAGPPQNPFPTPIHAPRALLIRDFRAGPLPPGGLLGCV